MIGALARLARLARGTMWPMAPGVGAKTHRNERFTDRAREAMRRANHEAKVLNHEHIGAEHLLLGIVCVEGVGAAALSEAGVRPDKVRADVLKLVKAGPEMVTLGKLSLAPRTEKIIEYAIEEARNLNHDYVGTEHLLLGLLREGESVAGGVLERLGLTVERARDAVRRVLGGHGLAADDA